MKDFKFVVRTKPDEETIKEFHKVLAQALIDKYGIEVMKSIIKESDRFGDGDDDI